MTTKNEITGDLIQSKQTSDKYRAGWERIFGKKKEQALDQLAEEAQQLGMYDEKEKVDSSSET